MSNLARRLPPIDVPRHAGGFDFVAALARLAKASYTAGFAAQLQLAAAPTWLTLSEASQHSGLSIAFLRRLVKSKRLPSVRDRFIKVRRVDLDGLDNLSTLPESSRKRQAANDEVRQAICTRRKQC